MATKGLSGTMILCIFTLVAVVFFYPQSLSAKESFLMTPDGVKLFFEHVERDAAKGTAVFLHGWGMSYNEWSGFKEKVADDGWNTMAFDFRGHGASIETAKKQLDYQKMTSKRNRKKLLTDIRMVMDYLMTSDNVWIIGSSVGANYALRYAAEDKRVAGVVLISPGYDDFGILSKKTIKQYGNRPVLTIAARNNPWSMRTSMDIKNNATGRSAFFGVQSGHDLQGFKDKTPFVGLTLDWMNAQGAEIGNAYDLKYSVEPGAVPIDISIQKVQ